jgi:phage tail tape-measure protein
MRLTQGMAENTHTLNYPTVVAGAVAAATATALSHQLGLVGTVIGAAVASVISAVVTNALGGWIGHLHGATRDRDPLPFQRLLVGIGAIALVVLAFHTGLNLLTSGIPADSFAGRLVAQIGLR